MHNTDWLSAFKARTQETVRSPERGDVPGWVMVTVMTAGLVVAIFSVFRSAIMEAIQTAISQVVSGSGP